MTAATTTIDPKWYRQVLGQYPTGVCVITARSSAGEPIAMVVGSFTSVSLAPPLVAFFPDRRSASWSKLRDCDHFCINILAADQEAVCRTLASKDPDKFAGVPHDLSARGNPVLTGVVAWVECARHSITDAGDHEMVLGRVLELDLASGGLPLLFFQGGYGRFSPASIGAEGDGLSLSQLREVDVARPQMERLVARLGGRCIATVRLADHLVVAASAGQARRGGSATLVGQRLPFMPPTGAVFAAWLPESEAEAWLRRLSTSETREAARSALTKVRERGFSVGLLNQAQRDLYDRIVSVADGVAPHVHVEDLLDTLSYDPPELTPEALRAIRVISAPAFHADGAVALAISVHDFDKPQGSRGVHEHIEEVVNCARSITQKILPRTDWPLA